MAESKSSTGIEYRPIPKHPGYRISSMGRIESCWRRGGSNPTMVEEWRAIKTSWHRGYQFAVLNGKTRCVHSLVLEAFVGPRPSQMEARHFNDDKDDNRLENLRWGTRLANRQDAIRNGKTPVGERNGLSKLTKKQITELTNRHCNGASITSLAKELGVGWNTIYRALSGQTYNESRRRSLVSSKK